MTLIDRFSVALLSLGILLGVLGAITLIARVRHGVVLKELTHIRVKNKRKRKKISTKKKQLVIKRQRLLYFLIFLIFFAGLSTSASVYAMYYQATNLTEEDQKTIAEGYILVQAVEDQLQEDNSVGMDDKISANLRIFGTELSAYSIKRADNHLSSTSQYNINRYYLLLKELGQTIASQPTDFYTNSVQLENIQEVIKKVKKQEQVVIEEFRIDEAALNTTKDNK
ncbi:hypothetical protein [Enterococcus wangshanyuanii]|uniref:Uncharacterized protein n=1 Tax=Enterococcus wangshanyuanii TaxID=2005703 RepID=A0ABQ1PTE3_9ENTE|nr:hypothetical protein [Enterococcus wangshanyuanii]GGD02959.1 hypothetical protein GCM10011573_35540 [Enterococcus wangshanyuanii]